MSLFTRVIYKNKSAEKNVKKVLLRYNDKISKVVQKTNIKIFSRV